MNKSKMCEDGKSMKADKVNIHKLSGVLLKRGEIFPNGDVLSKDCIISIGKGVVGSPVFNDFDYKQIVGEVVSISVENDVVIANTEIKDAYMLGKELGMGCTANISSCVKDARIIDDITIKQISLVTKLKRNE